MLEIQSHQSRLWSNQNFHVFQRGLEEREQWKKMERRSSGLPATYAVLRYRCARMQPPDKSLQPPEKQLQILHMVSPVRIQHVPDLQQKHRELQVNPELSSEEDLEKEEDGRMKDDDYEHEWTDGNSDKEFINCLFPRNLLLNSRPTNLWLKKERSMLTSLKKISETIVKSKIPEPNLKLQTLMILNLKFTITKFNLKLSVVYNSINLHIIAILHQVK